MTLSKGGRELAPGILQSPSGAANSQTHRELALASPRGLGLSPRCPALPGLQGTVPREGGLAVHSATAGRPRAGRGRRGYAGLGFMSVYSPNALLLKAPNPGTECSGNKSCRRWASTTFCPAVPAGLLLPLPFESPVQVPNSPWLSSGCSLLGPAPGSRPPGCQSVLNILSTVFPVLTSVGWRMGSLCCRERLPALLRVEGAPDSQGAFQIRSQGALWMRDPSP